MRLLTDDYRSAVLRRCSLTVLALVLAATAAASTRTDERRLDLDIELVDSVGASHLSERERATQYRR